MTEFRSSEKTITTRRENVYAYISDINNFNSLVPGDAARDFEADRDGCRFTVNGLGRVGVRVISREPEKTVEFESEGDIPFQVNLLIELEETGPESTVMRMILRADLNMMMMMVAKNPLREGLEEVASKLSEHLNERQWS